MTNPPTLGAVIHRFNDACTQYREAMDALDHGDLHQYESHLNYAVRQAVGALELSLKLYLRHACSVSPADARALEQPSFHELIRLMDQYANPRLTPSERSRLHAYRQMRNPAEHEAAVPRNEDARSAIREIRALLLRYLPINPDDLSDVELPAKAPPAQQHRGDQATAAGPATKISEPVILIRVNRLYRAGMSAEELYEVTRAAWKVGARRNGAEYAFAVYKGVVREVYRINTWHPAGTTRYQTRRSVDVAVAGRWEFEGIVAEAAVRDKYVGRSVADYFAVNSQNPISYVNC